MKVFWGWNCFYLNYMLVSESCWRHLAWLQRSVAC